MTLSRIAPTVLVLTIVLLAGAALRALYLRECAANPDFAAPLADPAFHDYWARALLDGDWTPPAGELDPRIRETPFQRPPGYPYFLAFAYAITGGSPLGGRIVQMALGLASVVLAYFLGRALFSRAVGLVLAAFCSTYWIFPYYEGELHAPALITALHLVLCLLLVAWAKRPSAWRAFPMGAVLGLTALVQANALLFVPFGALWIVGGARRLGRSRGAWRDALAFLAGVTIAIAPVTIRNWVVAKDFVLIASNGAINFYIGNNPEADGVSVRIPNLQEIALMSGWSWFSYDRIVKGLSIAEGQPLKYSQASRAFTRRALAFIRDEPRKFAALCLKRAALFWGPAEVSNNKAVQVDKDKSPTLRRLPGFPWVLSLSLVGAGGLVLASRRRRDEEEGVSLEREARERARAAPAALDPWSVVALTGIALFVLAYFLSFVPFLAAARFRAPILPAVFLFGAWGIVRVVESVRARSWKGVAIGAVFWVALFAVCRHSFFDSGPDLAWWHTDRAASLAQEGKLQEAVAELEEALRANPGYVDAHVNLGGTLAQLNRFDEAIEHYQDVLRNRPDRHDVRLRLGELLLRTGKFEDAARELEEVVRANPESAGAHFELGRALIETKRDEEGIAKMRRSLELNPKQSEAHVNIGIVLARRGDHAGALDEYENALQVDSFSAGAHFQRGVSFEALGRVAEAEKEYLEAFRLNPDTVRPPITLGNLYLVQGRNADAERWYRRAIGIDPRDLVARCNLAGALTNQGKYEDAVRELEAALAVDPRHPIALERLRVLREYLASQGGAPRE